MGPRTRGTAKRGAARTADVPADLDDVVDAVLRASRVLVAVAARSLAPAAGNVTIPQFRALVVLGARGPQNAGALADALGVHASTLTRLTDRLVAKGLITRANEEDNRRRVLLSLTPSGRRVLRAVTDRRRREIARIVRGVPPHQREAMVAALHAFGEAAGEPDDGSWSPEWLGE